VANVDAIDNVQGCETVNKTGSGGPGGQGGPDVRPDDGGPSAGALSVRIGKVKLAKALKRGVAVNVTTPGPGKVTLKAKRGSKVVASGSGKAGANGAAKLKLKFTKAGRKALKKAKSAKLTVDVTYKPASGDAVKSRVKLTLKR
jgi:hypothetical protein